MKKSTLVFLILFLSINLIHAQGIIWSDDFSTNSNWTSQNFGQGEWTREFAMTDQQNQYSFPFNPETKQNGYYVFDGFQYIWETIADPQDSRLEMNSSVNCLNNDAVYVRFMQSYRRYNTDECWLDVSGDNGQTWDGIRINLEVNPGELARADTLKIVDISTYAAHLSEVKVRLRWKNESDDDTFGSGYYWFVDDFAIYETYEDLGLESESMDDFSLFPNPATSQISFQPKTKENYQVSISGIDGNNYIKLNNLNGVTTLNINELSSGLYFVNIETKTGNNVKSFIKR